MLHGSRLKAQVPWLMREAHAWPRGPGADTGLHEPWATSHEPASMHQAPRFPGIGGDFSCQISQIYQIPSTPVWWQIRCSSFQVTWNWNATTSGRASWGGETPTTRVPQRVARCRIGNRNGLVGWISLNWKQKRMFKVSFLNGNYKISNSCVLSNIDPISKISIYVIEITKIPILGFWNILILYSQFPRIY